MKKHLLLIPFILLVTVCTSVAQDDIAMQTAEGSMMTKNYTSAENNFSKYIKSISANLPAYLQKAAVYDTATPFVRNFKFPDFAYNRKWSQAYCERGMARLNTGSKDSAYADFNASIRIDPTYAEPYYQAGAIAKDKGDKVKSCIFLGKARTLSDTLKRAKDLFTMNFCWMCAADYFKTGKNHVDLKEYKEGLVSLNLAVLICPDSATYYAYRGAAFDGVGKADSALMDYSSALKLDSSNYLAYYHRAIAYENKQQYTEAFNDLTKSININPTFADAYTHRAQDAENMGKEAAAQYDYKQLIRLKPNDGEAYYKVGLYLKSAGQDACDYFQKALDRGIDDAQGYVDDCKKAAAKENRMR